MRIFRSLFLVLLVGWLTVLAGCGSTIDADRPPPEGGAGGSSTSTGEDGTGGAANSGGAGGTGGVIFGPTGGTGGASTCDGECWPWKPATFHGLSLFWIGTGEPPPCPADVAPSVGLVGYAEPDAPFTCPSCSCSPAGCAMPGEMHVSAAACPAQGAPSFSWDSPGWDGACTAQGAIPAGVTCGGVSCTQSLTIGAPVVEPCPSVSEGIESFGPVSWGKAVEECILAPPTGEGCPGSEVCVPAVPDGFSLCLYHAGKDLTVEGCPDTYSRYVLVAANGEVDDTRACEPCSCSAPEGAACSALVSVYYDGACTTTLAAATASLEDPACVDLPASGVGLGSKKATWTVQQPGTCASFGGPVGGVAPSIPVTLCCEPERMPAK